MIVLREGEIVVRRLKIKSLGLLALCVFIAACDGPPTPTADTHSDQQIFLRNLRALCGQSFAGQLVSTDDADADFRDLPMTMHVRDCDDIIRIPFHVGDDRSRTWVITDLGEDLLLEHDHRHEDGTSDVLTLYGGQTMDDGASGRYTNTHSAQNFPANDSTKALFIREGIEVSAQNTWRIEVQPGALFAYQMSRPGRMFRVEFDLSSPVETPPPAWGHGSQ